MIRELHFPTPIYIFDHNDPSLNVQLEKDILNWMNEDKGVTKTNIKGWHSTTDMDRKPEYQRLVQGLFEAQNKIYEEEHLTSEPFLGGMWANVNPPGGMNRAHIHPNSLWSGVYYVKAPENCGSFIVTNPNSVSRERITASERKTEFNRNIAQIKPKEGDLLLFPAYLPHSVGMNLSEEDRIVISFNIDILK